METLLWALLLVPLAGAVVNVLLGRRLPRQVAGWLASGAVALAFLIGVMATLRLLALPAEERAYVTPTLYTWALAGRFEVPVSLLFDQLAAVMVLVVTGVGFLIHVYSVGYMAHEPADYDFRRYFVYLNLFVFSMLLLVLGSNFVLLYAGWELVGLCSYLLISFWYTEPQNAAAGRKAFVVNRVGDFAFALGIFLIWSAFGSVVYADVFEAVGGVAPATLTAITLLLFVGCTGKSAQLPLYVWLPDAMAGPTPVSALIHAATMVTAGVYLIARASALFAAATSTSAIVAWVGVLTALFAATIAIVQVDIKRVLAYSTISQLGYMFLGVGVGAYTAAIFHLVTHAFFKALLFLGAGSVMHAVEHGAHHAGEHVDPQDMRQMGGLWERARWTGITFLVGAAALAGLPLTSGFFSKDEILAGAFLEGHVLLYGVGLLTAFLTATYSFRQFFLVFAGEPRSEAARHAAESPRVMLVPLAVLAVLALGAGLVLGWPPEHGIIHTWLEPAFAVAREGTKAEGGAGLSPMTLLLISSVVALAGAGLAYGAYVRKAVDPAALSVRFRPLYVLLWNRYYVDELYALLFVRPFFGLARFLADVVDKLVIDGAVNGVATVTAGAHALARRLQAGYVRVYALSMVLGALLVLGYLVYWGR